MSTIYPQHIHTNAQGKHIVSVCSQPSHPYPLIPNAGTTPFGGINGFGSTIVNYISPRVGCAAIFAASYMMKSDVSN